MDSAGGGGLGNPDESPGRAAPRAVGAGDTPQGGSCFCYHVRLSLINLKNLSWF